MLCCRPKADEYELEEEGDKTLKEKKKSENQKTNSDSNGIHENIESPVEIKVTEAEPKLELSLTKAENQPESDIKGDDSKQSPDEKGDNSQFASQLSFTSQSTLREDISRSREKFFTGNYPIDESLSQGDRKSVSSTDERFAAHQSKIRASLVQPVLSAIQKVSNEDEMSAEEMKAVVNRLENVAQRLESLALNTPKAAGSSGSAPEAVAPFVTAYDGILSGNFAKFLELSSKLGGEVQAQANLVNNAFKAARDFLLVASKSKKPSQTDLQTIVKPISDQIGEIQQFRESNRTSKLFNHLSAISESIPALGWVVVEPTPNPFVKDMKDAGIFYTNRVLKDYKGKDGGEPHCDWTKAWNATLTDLMDYIKQNHTTGVSWNPQGGDAKSVSVKSAPATGGAPPPPPPGGAPPPPPPPPPVEDIAPASGGDGTDAARAQLFADLNKGSAITSGLKKVTDDMKTHKNPALRAQPTSGVRSGPAPFKAANTGPKTAPKPSAPVTKPPVFELQEKKWIIENQIGNKNLVIENTNLKQVVYIYKCVDSLITVKGKVNSINVDSCKKVSVLLDDVVSSVEFVNSQSVKAQVTGKCPTASIDKTDGCMLYLSKDSLGAEIVTAKSSEMNILVPNPEDESDFLEFPLPEQFKSTWNGKKFKTECTESI